MYMGNVPLRRKSYRQIIASLTLALILLVGIWVATLRAVVIYTNNQDTAGVTITRVK